VLAIATPLTRGACHPEPVNGACAGGAEMNLFGREPRVQDRDNSVSPEGAEESIGYIFGISPVSV
jgi:hypothetical protein